MEESEFKKSIKITLNKNGKSRNIRLFLDLRQFSAFSHVWIKCPSFRYEKITMDIELDEKWDHCIHCPISKFIHFPPKLFGPLFDGIHSDQFLALDKNFFCDFLRQKKLCHLWK